MKPEGELQAMQWREEAEAEVIQWEEKVKGMEFDSTVEYPDSPEIL